MPDFEQLKKELAKPGVTLQFLWEEYSDRCRLSGLKPYLNIPLKGKSELREYYNCVF